MGLAYLITGEPRIGKTTILMNVLEAVSLKRVNGFYTKEIQRDNQRVGFEAVTLSGRKSVISHVDFKDFPMIGKYGVDIEEIQKICVSEIKEGLEMENIVFIDEIGPMELLSKSFESIIVEALDSSSPIIGSIVLRSHPFTDLLKKNEKVSLISVQLNNRETVTSNLIEIMDSLLSSLKSFKNL